MNEGCYFSLSSSCLHLQQPATDLGWGTGWGPPAQEVDVNPGVCERPDWCWIAALPGAAPLPLCCCVSVRGFGQRAEAGCSGLRGLHSSGQKSSTILLLLQPVLMQAVTTTQALKCVFATAFRATLPLQTRSQHSANG